MRSGDKWVYLLFGGDIHMVVAWTMDTTYSTEYGSGGGGFRSGTGRTMKMGAFHNDAIEGAVSVGLGAGH